MKLTKDECRILGAALRSSKYEINDRGIPGCMDKLEDLENRLDENSKDKRRQGRINSDWFSDCLRRFSERKVKTI